MQSPATRNGLVARLPDDPWALSLAQRAQLAEAMRGEQATWLPRIRAFVEPPEPDAHFPAFLLALPRFVALARRIAAARARRDLDVGTLDELQRFVDLYRRWLSESEVRHPANVR